MTTQEFNDKRDTISRAMNELFSMTFDHAENLVTEHGQSRNGIEPRAWMALSKRLGDMHDEIDSLVAPAN